MGIEDEAELNRLGIKQPTRSYILVWQAGLNDMYHTQLLVNQVARLYESYKGDWTKMYLDCLHFAEQERELGGSSPEKIVQTMISRHRIDLETE